MSSFHDLSHVLVALPNERTIHLFIRLTTGTQIVETTALIDCGATGNFIDIGLLSKVNFLLQYYDTFSFSYLFPHLNSAPSLLPLHSSAQRDQLLFTYL